MRISIVSLLATLVGDAFIDILLMFWLTYLNGSPDLLFYHNLQIYQMMYPNEEFFPETKTSDIPEDNDDIDTETEPR